MRGSGTSRARGQRANQGRLARHLIARWRYIITALRAGKGARQIALEWEVSEELIRRDIACLRDHLGLTIHTPRGNSAFKATREVHGPCPFCEREL